MKLSIVLSGRVNKRAMVKLSAVRYYSRQRKLASINNGGVSYSCWRQSLQHNVPSYSAMACIFRPKTPTSRGTWRNYGETRGGVGKSGVLEHNGGNVSETR